MSTAHSISELASQLAKLTAEKRIRNIPPQQRQKSARAGGLLRKVRGACPWCGVFYIKKALRLRHLDMCTKRPPGAEIPPDKL